MTFKTRWHQRRWWWWWCQMLSTFLNLTWLSWKCFLTGHPVAMITFSSLKQTWAAFKPPSLSWPWSLVVYSLTRWSDYLFYIWLFAPMKIYQNKLKNLANIKWTLSKLPKCFNIVPKWQNFAESCHTVVAPLLLGFCFSVHSIDVPPPIIWAPSSYKSR